MSNSLALIYFLFALSTLLAVWCFASTRKLTRKDRRVTAALVSSVVPFLISFAAVSGVFSIVGTVLYWADQDSRTIETLYRVETSVQYLRNVVGQVELSTWQSVGVLAGLWLFSLVRIFILGYTRDSALGRTTSRASIIFRRYSKTVACFSTVLTLFSCFTFFATAVDPQLGTLEIRIKKAEQEIVQLGAGVMRVFSEEIRGAILESVEATAPADVSDGLTRVKEVNTKVSNMQQKYRHGPMFEDPMVDAMGERQLAVREALRQPLVHVDEAQSRRESTVAPNEIRSVLTTLTGDELKTAGERLDKLRDDKKKRLTNIQDDDGRSLTEKIVHGVVELGLDRDQYPLKNLINELPFAEPLLDVFEKVISKLATDALEPDVIHSSLHKLVAAFRREPGTDAGDALRSEANRLVKEHGNSEQFWNEYLRAHPNKLGQEQEKLTEREVRVEQARVNVAKYEADEAERRRNREGKVDLTSNSGGTRDPISELSRKLAEKQSSSRREQKPTLADVTPEYGKHGQFDSKESSNRSGYEPGPHRSDPFEGPKNKKPRFRGK